MRYVRKRRIRKNISGTSNRPRLSVFRSARHIYAQAIDDNKGNTLAYASSLELSEPASKNGAPPKTTTSMDVGKIIAERLISKGVSKVVFDRGGYLYHGRVKALAEAARKAGLNF